MGSLLLGYRTSSSSQQTKLRKLYVHVQVYAQLLLQVRIYSLFARATRQSWSGCRFLHSPVSPLHQYPHLINSITLLLSLPASHQLSEHGPSPGSGSAGPAHRLLSARLTSHAACASQALASISLHGLVPPGTTRQPVALRTSIDPPGPRSLESCMLR